MSDNALPFRHETLNFSKRSTAIDLLTVSQLMCAAIFVALREHIVHSCALRSNVLLNVETNAFLYLHCSSFGFPKFLKPFPVTCSVH